MEWFKKAWDKVFSDDDPEYDLPKDISEPVTGLLLRMEEVPEEFVVSRIISQRENRLDYITINDVVYSFKVQISYNGQFGSNFKGRSHTPKFLTEDEVDVLQSKAFLMVDEQEKYEAGAMRQVIINKYAGEPNNG